ncbi:MAG TPA: DUF424 domain-containing protein [Methanoregulaceae archaeon]|nr:DUF424 domain-containing protein [Methanoregulaceae archaeon]
MYLKIHRAYDGSSVVAVCDRELLNRRIRHGEIEIHVSESFYGTTPASESEVANAIREADNINIIGVRAVAVAAGLGLIDPSGCLLIDGIPHAQIFRI